MHFSLCDYLLDIVQNAVEAAADVISVRITEGEDRVAFFVEDNGSGMSEEMLERVRDPFFTNGEKHRKRRAGLGIPFLVQATEACNGDFRISSVPGQGTAISFSMDRHSIDLPPFGDIVSTVMTLMTCDGAYDLLFEHCRPEGDYAIRRSDLLEALGDLETAESLSLAKSYITECEETT
ncbi:MAG: ATP-binding protein [Fibrobacterota bacterium]